ncbi:x globin isoform X2 [Hippocampus zosterae]|uniref:x globin isoform X2 n=1 Tax=Hippocampus zosterae TaxID=109293 RepID=UPI00223DB60D|nr:x globin isoform X2 [Hippocampus zosterae]
MGCAISGLAETADLGEKSTRDAGRRGGGAHPSQNQIDMINESWKVIRDDIAKVGIIVFVRLFETHPECKDVFFLFRDVKDLERLRTSRELRAHGLRVMSFIEKSVARLDQLERLEALAEELGKSHYHYNAPPQYYSTMFQYVTRLMKKGYEDEDRENQAAASPKERGHKRNTAP